MKQAEDTRRLSREEVREAARTLKRSCGVIPVARPSALIRAHRKENRAGKVALALMLTGVAVLLLGGLVLAGCGTFSWGGSLQTTGKVLEVGGAAASAFPPLAIVGSIAAIVGGAMAKIGAKIDKPLIRNVGFVAALAGLGGVGSEYQALTGTANDPKPGQSIMRSDEAPAAPTGTAVAE